MHIAEPRLRRHAGRIFHETDVSGGPSPPVLSYSVADRYAGLLSTACDAALVALLLPAMARGEDIEVAGRLSERLYYSLEPLQQLLRLIMPFLRKVEVRAAFLDADRPAAPGVATGFSGGIDSFCALADHHYAQDVPAGFRLTHLLCNNVGSHDAGGQDTFRRRYQRLLPLAERLGLPYVDVDSNLDAFYDERLHFQQTHTLRNASVPLLLGGGIGRFMYASAHSFRDVALAPAHDTAPADLVLLPMLSTESTECFSIGSQYSRVDKTLRIADLADTHDFLDVCTKTWTVRNCGVCPKCKRTAMTLEIAGKLQAYERVFDLDAYRKVRSGYLGRVFHDADPFCREIAAFARERGFARGAYARLYGAAWRTKESVKRLAAGASAHGN